MEYRYKLKYPDNLGDKERNKYKSKVSAQEGVAQAVFDGDYLTINCIDGAYEYDILQTLIAISDEYEIEVLFGENDDNGPIDGDLEDSDGQEPIDDDNGESLEENSEEATDKQSKLDYDDKLTAEKQTLKKDSLIRIGELSIAIILFVVSLFLKAGDTVFSFKTILAILAFSISGYDIVFNAGLDIFKKRILSGNLFVFIAAVALIVLGQSEVSTAVIILFAIAKFIEDYAAKRNDLTKKGVFYTGTTPVTVNGEESPREEIKSGSLLTIKEGDVLPVDGVLTCDAEVVSYNVDYSLKSEYKMGEKVLAGSVAITDLTYESSCDYGASEIDERKKSFEEKAENFGGKKSGKWSKIGLYADLFMIFIALAVTFLLPLTNGDYVEGLKKWAVIGGALLSFSLISLTVLRTNKIFKNLYTEGFSKGIDFNDLISTEKLGKANAMKVSAAALCDQTGAKLKEDSLGALKELNVLGIKKVSTDFDLELSNAVKKQIDFVEPTLKKENSVYFGNNSGDVALLGGNVNVFNGEISFVPLAYKMAKKAVKLAKFSLFTSIAVKVLLAALVVILAFLGVNAAYLATVGVGFEVLFTALLLFVRSK